MSLIKKVMRRFWWSFFSAFPKDKSKVVLQSYYGRGFSDSPKAIAQELIKRKDFKVYWVVAGDEEAKSLPSEIKPIKIDTMKSIYHLCTAGVWIDNARKWAFTKKKKSQYYIQTWHGFPLKRIEKDAGDALPSDYIEAAKHDSKITDLYISNSSFLTNIYKTGFWYDGEVLECGFPRNDILVNGDTKVAESARKWLGLGEEKKIMLYAPTFRKDKGLSVYDMDYEKVVKSLNESFGGDWIILAKLHPNIAKKAAELDLDKRFVMNASDYPDIQDLYLLADAMISDYSSVMFDFTATKKPCFLYINDLESYKNDRNFYFDIDKLPYKRAESNDELEALIQSFDSTEQAKMLDAFTKEFDIKENGTASVAVADIIEKKRSEL